MKKVLVVAAVMSLASVASADLMLEMTENAPPLAGLRSFTLTFKGVTAGDKFSAFDGNLTGPMSQNWYWWKAPDWVTTVWVGDFVLPGEAASAAVDTHLLFDPHDANHVLIASEPTEYVDTTGWGLGVAPPTPDVNDYQRGLGTYMATTATSNMAFAVPALYQVTVQPFAQVVVPDGEIVLLNATVVANNGYGLVLVDYPIPEPATLGLLALGAAGALIRRRRR